MTRDGSEPYPSDIEQQGSTNGKDQLGHLPAQERPYEQQRVPSLLTVKDVRRLLPQLGRDALYALMKSGAIPSVRVAGKLLTTYQAVQRWIDRITNGSMGEDAKQR